MHTAFGIGYGSPRLSCSTASSVADLAEAVAAQLQRRGHEAEAPLADVERGAPVVIDRRIAVRHDHLGEGHPVRDGPDPALVLVADAVQHQAFAVVEPDPHPPALPAQLVAVQGERHTVRLADLQRLQVLALLQPGDLLGHVLAHHRRRIDRAGVLDLQQLHRVEVDHEVQPADVVGVGVATGRVPAPDVAPADPTAPVPLREDRVAVGPHVDVHHRRVGDTPPGQRLDDRGVLG